MKNTVLFRTDGNSIIGTGHVMRCLSIAEQLSNNDVDVVFINADKEMSEVIEKRGYKTYCLGTNWNRLDEEIDRLCEVVGEYNAYAVVVDTYYVTEKYLQELNRCIRVYYIDDLNSFKYPVSYIINYNIYSLLIDYDKEYYDELYIGTLYAPLRSEFIGIDERIYSGIKKILITSGGTDEFNVVGNILENFVNNNYYSDKEFYCVLGIFNSHIMELKKKYDCYDNVHFLINIDNMAEYMKSCDVAITAGGTTCYELCACGIPFIIYSLADNQLQIAESFSTMGIAPWVGDIRKDLKQCICNIDTEIKRLSNIESWMNRSRLIQKLVDGNGAKRIAEALTNR